MIEVGEAVQGSFDDLEMPETLYKYRDWRDMNHRRMISHREVFFASPSSFEDKLDCKNPTRWDLLTYGEILDKYYHDCPQLHPNFTNEERVSFAIDWANHTMVNNKEYVDEQQKKTFKEFDAFSGVLSLTAYPKEETMWNKYSINHSGFCIGFDPKIMLRGLGTGGGIVHYDDELPVIHPSPKHSHMQQTIFQIFFKLREWEFEKEYRAYKFRPYPLTIGDRAVVVPPEAFKELILGANMSEENEQLVISSIPQQINHIRLKKAFLENVGIVIKDI
ncbi:MAG: DUF2971 domain-containing protein [Bacteroidota bacterium]|uniref:DUF2971 domain-containing protein n=1 Tax=Mucilaginibacter inviolabilis TaxID=2714892 RepID=UPI00140CEF7B|nr:DUF2971 domain-containing protein [Mucilaginibacter inviolabilis]NHA05880.1 DUF2971 domain-containing protein [Mucilaginibacter inviolabilis]